MVVYENIYDMAKKHISKCGNQKVEDAGALSMAITIASGNMSYALAIYNICGKDRYVVGQFARLLESECLL